MNFTKLAQANVDHYNAHPVIHIATTVVYGVVAFAVINRGIKRLCNVPKN